MTVRRREKWEGQRGEKQELVEERSIGERNEGQKREKMRVVEEKMGNCDGLTSIIKRSKRLPNIVAILSQDMWFDAHV